VISLIMIFFGIQGFRKARITDREITRVLTGDPRYMDLLNSIREP
jgi:hypothetical protein